jgi:hypothetical protein
MAHYLLHLLGIFACTTVLAFLMVTLILRLTR